MCSAYKPELSFGPCSCLLTLLFDLAGRHVVTDASLNVLYTGVKQTFGLWDSDFGLRNNAMHSFIILMSVLFSINCTPVP